MSVTFVAAGAADTSPEPDGVDLTIPACSVGDTLLAVIATYYATYNAPAGWTLVATIGQPRLHVYSRTAQAGDVGVVVSFNPNESSTLNITQGVICAWSGIIGGIQSATLKNPGDGTTITPPVLAQGQVVVGIGAWHGQSGTLTLQPGANSRYLLTATSGDPKRTGLYIADWLPGYGHLTGPSGIGPSDGWTAATLVLDANQPPNAPILTNPSDGSPVDLTATNRFTWTPSDDDMGDSQSAADLRYRVVGGSTWTTVSIPLPTSFWDAVAGTFTAANHEWQVRTYDALGVVGPWCTSNFFTANTPPPGPSITAPVSGSTVPASVTLTWSTSTQDSYRVRRVADNGGAPDATIIYYDSGIVGEPTTRSLTVTFDTNGRYEHLQVQTIVGGLPSPWASSRNPVSYTPPASPVVTLAADGGSGSILVSIFNPAAPVGEPSVIYNDIEVNDGDGWERRATLLPPNQAWRYWTPKSLRDYAGNIRVVSVGDNGTTASTVA